MVSYNKYQQFKDRLYKFEYNNKEKLIDSQDIRKKTSSENRSIKTVFEESLGCKYNYYSCNQCSFKTKINCELMEHSNNQHCQPQNSNIEKKTDKEDTPKIKSKIVYEKTFQLNKWQ